MIPMLRISSTNSRRTAWSTHWAQTICRCVLSRLIYGIRPTLGLALLTMLGTIALGALLGVMAGYFRGVVEEVIMRVVDVMLSFPSQIMVFAVVGLLGINVQNVIIANVFIKWRGMPHDPNRCHAVPGPELCSVLPVRGNAGAVHPVPTPSAVYYL